MLQAAGCRLQAAAFHVGATFNQHLMAMPGARPPLPVLMPPILPVGASPQVPMTTAVRPPVLLPPVGTPGYGAVPTVAALPPTVLPPGAPTSTPTQPSSLPRPPKSAPPIPGAMTMPATSTVPALYQCNPASSTTTNFESFNTTSGSAAP